MKNNRGFRKWVSLLSWGKAILYSRGLGKVGRLLQEGGFLRTLFWGQQKANWIIPRKTIVSQSLIFVIATMCFLACLSLVAVFLVSRTAHGWIDSVSREVTVELGPVADIDPQSQVAGAMKVISGTRGIRAVHLYNETEMRALLNPWISSDFDLQGLPLPILIAVELDESGVFDLVRMSEEMSRLVPGSVVNDHRMWLGRAQSLASWISYTAFLVFFLVFSATGSIIFFATRSAMESNRGIIEVLNLVGAKPAFITEQFGRHFLVLGFQGGLIGAISAISIFELMRFFMPPLPSFSGTGWAFLGWEGYAGIFGMVLILSVQSTLVSYLTVARQLKNLN